jgi:hypothetical protein
MSEYILQELKKSLEHPTRDELLDRIARFPQLKLRPPPAVVIRAERDG